MSKPDEMTVTLILEGMQGENLPIGGDRRGRCGDRRCVAHQVLFRGSPTLTRVRQISCISAVNLWRV